ncbi:hypothetical protein [Pseudoduganella violaceinigra]|uniref:hypothetical protein n=1 Tax=Pseudoduganella violaceinigra TaxID=246602 RepID=UPI000412F223|nr:hypothetical protein [Pseudoduganella violaceinigra]
MQPRLCALLLLLAMPAKAQEPTEGWAPVAAQRLDAARGGFETGNGLLVALGVERMVEVNGVVVARTHIELTDVARLQDAPAVRSALAPLLLQNNANGQLIRSLTRIDLTVNALSTLKSLNLEGSVRQALSNAVVPR